MIRINESNFIYTIILSLLVLIVGCINDGPRDEINQPVFDETLIDSLKIEILTDTIHLGIKEHYSSSGNNLPKFNINTDSSLNDSLKIIFYLTSYFYVENNRPQIYLDNKWFNDTVFIIFSYNDSALSDYIDEYRVLTPLNKIMKPIQDHVDIDSLEIFKNENKVVKLFTFQ